MLLASDVAAGFAVEDVVLLRMEYGAVRCTEVSGYTGAAVQPVCLRRVVCL